MSGSKLLSINSCIDLLGANFGCLFLAVVGTDTLLHKNRKKRKKVKNQKSVSLKKSLTKKSENRKSVGFKKSRFGSVFDILVRFKPNRRHHYYIYINANYSVVTELQKQLRFFSLIFF